MSWQTHEVFNQPPILEDYNLFTTDPILMAAVEREGAGWCRERLERYGARLGSAEMLRDGDLANRMRPELHTHDRRGYRVDRVEFHPAWHQMLAAMFGEGFHCLPWSDPRPGAHVARAAGYLMHAQVEAGAMCPVTMTFGAIPVLRREPSLFATVARQLYSREYDASDRPVAEKKSMLVGMGMSEKQGGSDVRSNTTTARPLGADGRGGEYAIVGHKWFLSAPMCDAHLVLARADDALSCFYVPRWRPDGSKNAVHLQRLKEKLGNASNASSEAEFCDAWGVLIGEKGRGVATIIEMATYTRLDCVIGSAGLMRQAFVQALHHARHRSAFGRLLLDQPLMRSVLADLALESEAATLLALRLARAFEGETALDQALRRIVTPAAKFWVCKRAVEFAGECMEVLGGNGYVEDGPLARLFRETPVNSIWEGSGNVMCLDVLRAAGSEPAAAETLLGDLRSRFGGHGVLGARLAALTDGMVRPEGRESRARWLAQELVLIVQAGLMLESAPAHVAEAFIASRFAPPGGRVFGVAAEALPEETILERSWAG